MSEDVLKKANENKEHTEQPENPHSFKYGEYEINMKFAENNKTLENCLINCFKHL